MATNKIEAQHLVEKLQHMYSKFMLFRRGALFILSLVLTVLFSSLIPLSPSLALMDSIPTKGAKSSRVVPIFLLESETSQQPTARVSFTGFLYSSRIVFTSGMEKVYGSGGSVPARSPHSIWIGKPGSSISDTTGRVKVIKRLQSTSYANEEGERNSFSVLILEKDLIDATPYPLLTPEIEREVSPLVEISGYGEFLDICAPGQKLPCLDKTPQFSEFPRTTSVSRISLEKIEKLLGYERPQLQDQMLFYNWNSPKSGAVCLGDAGAPIIGTFRYKKIYLGQMGMAMNLYGCGRSAEFDGMAGIHYASPVYRHMDIIREAKSFLLEEERKTAVPYGVSITLKTSKYDQHEKEDLTLIYHGDLRKRKNAPRGFRFFNKLKGQTTQIQQISLEQSKCKVINSEKYECKFPNFNPYSHISFKGIGSSLAAAAYNASGQGPISSSITMHELMLNPIFSSIEFVKFDQVVDAIYGSSRSNWFGLKSNTVNSKIQSRFTFDGQIPQKPKYSTPQVIEIKNDGTKLTHKMRLVKYRNGNPRHEFVFETDKEITIRGDSRFEASIEILDEDGFVRGFKNQEFTFNYHMNPLCSTTLLARLSVRDTSRASLQAIIIGINLVERYKNLYQAFQTPPGSREPISDPRESIMRKNFWTKFFKSPELVANVGLTAIDAIVANDNEVTFTVVSEVALELAENLTKEVAEQTVYKLSEKAGNLKVFADVPILTYQLTVPLADAVVLGKDLFRDLDEYGKKNGEAVSEYCAQTGNLNS